MKLGRFQLALNHEDPNIVIQGLNEFTQKILYEHNAIESFGYNGRSLLTYQSLKTNFPTDIKGLLHDYLLSSPQIEELFVLWKIPGRNDNSDLIIYHTQCLAAILHCAKSDARCCSRIVTRILSEFSRSLSNQLTMGHLSIVHSTLGLLLSMCSSSQQNCRDTYQKLINHLTPLQTLLQKGKSVSTETGGKKVQTDSRHLIVLLVLVTLYHSDFTMGNELIASKGLFNRVVNGIHKDSFDTINQFFHGLDEILNSEIVPDNIKVNIIDSASLTKILGVSDEHNKSFRKLLSTYCHILINVKSNSVSKMHLLIKTLTPHIDLFHRELIGILLKAKPQLMSKCLNAIPIEWDQPVLSSSYLSAITYVCYILDETEIDIHLLKSFASGKSVVSDLDIKNMVNEVCSSLLPTGLTKKDISKLLQHSSSLLRRVGLIVYHKLLLRIKRTLAILDKRSPYFPQIHAHLITSLTNLLPDIQLLLSMRARSVAILLTHITRVTESVSEVELREVDESFYFHSLILSVFETMLMVIPTIVQAQHPNFDFCKFLDDILPWSGDATITEIAALCTPSLDQKTVRYFFPQMLHHTIKVLRVASIAEQCAWFGSKADAVKLFTHLIVSPSWDNAKRNPLQKLLVLCILDVKQSYALVTAAQELLNLILDQSHLFDGHGKVVVEMTAERDSWLQVIQQSVCNPQRNWISIMDILLRISHHWDIELCFSATQLHTKIVSSWCNNSRGLLPFSPLFFATIHLLSLNFDPFQSQFPKFIQNHIESLNLSESTFFKKYITGFRGELNGFLGQVVFKLLSFLPDPPSYLHYVDAISKSLNGELGVHIFSDILSYFDESSSKLPLSNPNASHDDDMSIETISYLLKNSSKLFSARLFDGFESFITRWWDLLAIIFLFRKNISSSCVNWILNSIEKEGKKLLTLSLNRKIGLISLCIRFLSKLSSLSNSDYSDVCQKVIFLVVDLFNSVKSPSSLLEVINSWVNVSPEILSSFLLQQVFVSAAIMFLKEKNKKYPEWDNFWRKVFQTLVNHPDNNEQLDVICLSWSLQGVINDQSLHSSLVTYCIGDQIDGEGYELLTLPKHLICQTLIKLTPLVQTILQSGSLTSLSNAANKLCRDYISHPENSAPTLSNALSKVTFTINPYSSSNTFLDNYCDVLSLGLNQSIATIAAQSVLTVDDLQKIQQVVWLSSALHSSNLLWHPYCKLSYITFPLTKRKANIIADMLTSQSITCDQDINLSLHIWNLLRVAISKQLIHEDKLFVLDCFNNVLNLCPTMAPNVVPLLISTPNSKWYQLLFHLLSPIFLCSSFARTLNINWAEFYSKSLLCLLEDAIDLLKGLKSSPCMDNLDHIFGSILLLIDVSLTDVDTIPENLQTNLTQSFNKCIKLTLKFGLDISCTLNFVYHFSRLAEVNSNILALLSRDNNIGEILFSCPQLLEMIVSHSKFLSYVRLDNIFFLPLLRLLLFLVSFAVSRSVELPHSCLDFLIQALFSTYKATVSYLDRIIFRIFYLCQKAVVSSSGSEVKIVSNIFSYPLPHYAPNIDQSDNFQWVTNALTPPVVYQTLTSFPIWRSLIPAIFPFESTSAILDSIKVVQETFLAKESSFNEEEGSFTEQFAMIDWFEGISNSLDPSYWLPAFHCCLSNCRGLSMRVFANCGALAFTIAALGSKCGVIRVYARSCLQLIYEVLLTQTPDKDSAFKERPQLILLVSFIRNYFVDPRVDENNESSKLPASQALFLARAALHLLQPQHSLYTGVNKYLLSKPYCDVKDVPLYDALVMDADIQCDSNQRVAALRLLRDSLISHQDHLNMCRKHAYQRLMTSFLLFSKDPKVSHSILDIFDKALSISPSASRYVIDRCGFIPWLQHICSNLNRVTTSHSPDIISEKEVRDDHDSSHEASSFLLSAPHRLFGRVVCLLRKSLGILPFLQGKGIETIHHQHEICGASMFIVRDIIIVQSTSENWKDSHVPIEFLRQTILLLWDLFLFVSSQGSETRKLLRFHIRGEDLFQLAQICRNFRHSFAKLEYDELEVNLLSLFAFRNLVKFDSSSVSGARLIEISISQWTLGLDSAESLYCLSGETAPSTSETDQIYLFPSSFALGDQIDTLDHSAGCCLSNPNIGLAPVEYCLREIEGRNWNAFSQYSHEQSPLPCKLGKKFLVNTITRAILGVLCSAKDTINPSQYVRWSLLMKKCYFDTSAYFDNRIGHDISNLLQIKHQVAQRVYSCYDDGYFEDYTEPYDYYLFGYYLTVIALLSFLLSDLSNYDETKYEKTSLGNVICSTLKDALSTLLRTSTYSSTIDLQIRARDLCAHAKDYWHEGDDSRRIIYLLIAQSCDLLSSIYTIADRATSTAAEDLFTILNAPISDSSHFGEVLYHKSQMLLKNCRVYSPLTSSFQGSSESIWMEDIVQANTNTLPSFVGYNNINYEELINISKSSDGLNYLIEKMNVASSNYSLSGASLTHKESGSVIEEATKRTRDEESNEITHKRRRLFYSLQCTFTFNRRRRSNKKSIGRGR